MKRTMIKTTDKQIQNTLKVIIHTVGSSMNAPVMTPAKVTQILDSALGDLTTAHLFILFMRYSWQII